MRILVLLMFFFLAFADPAFTAITFQISNFEKVNDYYSVDAAISGAATGSAYYLQAMFKPTDSKNYFGNTWGQTGDWFKYVSSPNPDYVKANFPKIDNNSTLKVLLKPDTESSEYHGPGEYLLKLKRYTGESSSGTYADNSLTVTLSDPSPPPTPSPTSTPTASSIPSSSPPPTITPTVSSTKIPTPTPTKVTSPTAAPTSRGPTSTNSPTASVAAEILGISATATPSQEVVTPAVEVQTIEKDFRQTDTFTAIAVGITSIGLLGVIFYRLSKISIKERIK